MAAMTITPTTPAKLDGPSTTTFHAARLSDVDATRPNRAHQCAQDRAFCVA